MLNVTSVFLLHLGSPRMSWRHQ